MNGRTSKKTEQIKQTVEQHLERHPRFHRVCMFGFKYVLREGNKTQQQQNCHDRRGEENAYNENYYKRSS